MRPTFINMALLSIGLGGLFAFGHGPEAAIPWFIAGGLLAGIAMVGPALKTWMEEL